MKKESYQNKKHVPRIPIKSSDLPTPHSAEEGLSSDTGGGIGRGYSALGEGVMPPVHTELEDAVPIPLKRRRRQPSLDYDAFSELMIAIGDDMDRNGEEALAGLADFLIKKVAEQRSLNYPTLFGDLIVKISESDILNKNDVFIEITKEYNRALRSSIIMGKDPSEASMGAYQASAAKAKTYVR